MKHKKDRVGIIFVLSIAIMTILIPLQTQAASAKQKALSAYKNMLACPNSYRNLTGGRFPSYFAIAYIDKNKTPELAVRFDDSYGYDEEEYMGDLTSCDLFTFKSGKVRRVDTTQCKSWSDLKKNDWLEERSQLAGYYKKTGVYVWKTLTDSGKLEVVRKLKGGKRKRLAFGNQFWDMVHSRYKNTGYWRVGKKKVSKAAFKRYVKKVSKRKRLTKFNWLKNTAYNRNKAFGKTVTPAKRASKTRKVTQYRYADKKYTTSGSSSLSGWTRYKSSPVYGSWGTWSGWSGTAQSGSDTKEVQTRKEFRYYYFYCPKCGGHEPFQGTSDCHQYSLSLANAVEGWFPTAYSKCNSRAYSYTTEKRWTESLGDGQRWNFSTGNINDTAVGTHDYGFTTGSVIRNAYRYRTRSKSTKYYYYKWGTWSTWSTTRYTASDNRKVETRTVTVAA